MTTIVDVDGTWVNDAGVSYDAGELRLGDAALVGGRGDEYGARGGVARHSDTALRVTVSGADVVTVQPGSVVIPGTDVAGTGIYRAGISAAHTAALTVRDATHPRVDLVVFRQLDPDVVPTHPTYKSRIEIIAGAPSATPDAPVKPSMSIELGRINVPESGGGAATVDRTHVQYTVALGATLAVPSSDRLASLSAAKYDRAIALDTGLEYVWDGSDWILQASDSGWANVNTGVILTGTHRARRIGEVVHIHLDGACNVDNNDERTLNPSSPLSSDWRPSARVVAGCSLGGYPGVVQIDTDGLIVAINRTGADRTTLGAVFSYPLD